MDDQHVGPAGQPCDRGEGFDRIKRQLVVQRGIHRVMGGGNHQRVAVRIGFRTGFRPDDASGPAAVVHDNLLAETFGQFGGDLPSDEVVAPARRPRDDEPQRFGRIGIGRRKNRSRNNRKRRPERQQQEEGLEPPRGPVCHMNPPVQ